MNKGLKTEEKVLAEFQNGTVSMNKTLVCYE